MRLLEAGLWRVPTVDDFGYGRLSPDTLRPVDSGSGCKLSCSRSMRMVSSLATVVLMLEGTSTDFCCSMVMGVTRSTLLLLKCMLPGRDQERNGACRVEDAPVETGVNGTDVPLVEVGVCDREGVWLGLRATIGRLVE